MHRLRTRRGPSRAELFDRTAPPEGPEPQMHDHSISPDGHAGEPPTQPPKPRLLFLRFHKPGLPSFIQRHSAEHLYCLRQHFDVTLVTEDCDYQLLCETH